MPSATEGMKKLWRSQLRCLPRGGSAPCSTWVKPTARARGRQKSPPELLESVVVPLWGGGPLASNVLSLCLATRCAHCKSPSSFSRMGFYTTFCIFYFDNKFYKHCFVCADLKL